MAKFSKSKRRRIVQFIEYLISGGAYFWTGYGVFFISDSLLGFSLWWAKQTANVAGWTVNFILQRYWVFKNPHLKGHMGEVTLRYGFITLVNFVIDYYIIFGLKEIGISPYIGQFVSAGFFTLWNYFWYRFFVFPERYKVKVKHKRPRR